jgi:hypothetical protein
MKLLFLSRWVNSYYAILSLSSLVFALTLFPDLNIKKRAVKVLGGDWVLSTHGKEFGK